MSQARGSQLWLQYYPPDHAACKLDSFLEKQPMSQHVQVIYPCNEGTQEPPAKRLKSATTSRDPEAATASGAVTTGGPPQPASAAPQDWFQGATPLHYSTSAALPALVTEEFLMLAFGPGRFMAAVALQPQTRIPGVSAATVHPAGWLALTLSAAVYQRLGLTGHRVTGPKHHANVPPARRAHRGGEYAVLVKLKGLHNRPKHQRRVQEAFGRLEAPLAWRMAFLERGLPTVRRR